MLSPLNLKNRIMKKIVLPALLAATLLVSCSDDENEIVGGVIRPITAKSSAFVAEIVEYKPAPGQFINTSLGDAAAARSIVGSAKNGMVSLGGYGGYIIMGFDHSIINAGSAHDFAVYGNAYEGSSEPGIVMVSQDANGNGVADDAWYELAGSEHANAVKGYSIVYTNPKAAADVPWTDNKGASGAVLQNSFHAQEYFPLFLKDKETLSFTGTRLPDNKGTNSNGWVVLKAFAWGYADNFSAEYAEKGYNTFDIDWAVTATGEKANLKAIDFIKVYNGLNQDGGQIGETSTEIAGAADLAILK